MTGITGGIVTGVPADVAFGFVAGRRNEPACNPYMVRSAKRPDPGPLPGLLLGGLGAVMLSV